MKVSQNNQRLQKTKYLGSSAKDKVELEHKQRVHRGFSATSKGETSEFEYGSLERILSRQNLLLAMDRVISNKGSHGVDGMTVYELKQFLQTNWIHIRQDIFNDEYRPMPVRRVEIPKPNGGTRMLGIPTALDRFIQQAIAQELNLIYDKNFSENSFGFRPRRGAKDAIKQAERYINEGFRWVVDIDLEKFFDKVNHDTLMYKLSRDIKDKRVLKLIRRYLQSGIMINGIVVSNDEGTPQGGPLSPLLSNIMLDELDKELEKRGHRFCRYADDCNIFVKSKRAGERVMENVTNFIEGKLKLKVNKDKSAVERPWKRKFLGFTLGLMFGKAYSSISKQSLKKHKDKLRDILSRSKPMTLEQRIFKLNQINIGWINYYGVAKCKGIVVQLDKWIRQRLRMCIWKQWKKVKTRYKNLKKLGLSHYQAIKFSNTRKGYWRIANSAILNTTLTNQFFTDLGLKSLTRQYIKIH
ncbi:group II intron reverse transcriptase/maturase [Clostridium perfringens]|uniref:group II intron reverse transcriptase/maturase n=1 Tax=Clostridium perfringens TaxID=1502 RepID=UPI002AC5420E|nr:group II intron reverse transcriptase/maturase [Clostridium perfringens]MDZ4956888.1 group II intron reverse transcriptase/maturase [Clostridium perfringens]